MEILAGMAQFLAAFIGILLLVVLVFYVLGSIATMRVLRGLGYDKTWMAWIPFLNWYALADVLDEFEVRLLEVLPAIPMSGFKFWWVLYLAIPFIPIPGANAVAFIFMLICLGWTYTRVYAAMYGTDSGSQIFVGYASAIIGLIFMIKGLLYKG